MLSRGILITILAGISAIAPLKPRVVITISADSIYYRIRTWLP